MGVLMKIFFLAIFFLEGGPTKIFYEQTWANDGQTNAVSFFQKFEFGGAIFTELIYGSLLWKAASWTV